MTFWPRQSRRFSAGNMGVTCPHPTRQNHYGRTMPTYETATLSDRTVHRIGFGAKRLGHDRAHAIALLRHAVDSGVDHIDTADFYPTHAGPEHREHDSTALGWANEAIREALAPYPD